MKKIFIFQVLVVLFAPVFAQDFEKFGEEISSENVVKSEAIKALNFDESEQPINLSGTVESVCQAKGCWMKLWNGEDAPIRVTFKDYGFFVPKDISGQNVQVSGTIKKTVLSGEDAKHYAEDEGVEYDPNKEYAEYSLVATGVRVFN